MLKNKDILDEKDKRLRSTSKDVVFPLAKKEKKLILDMIEYLKRSQIDEIAEKENLRPGMGLAAIQLGLDKRFFVIVNEITEENDTEQKFENYIIVNPKIVSHSEELIAAEAGEGCLSVNREVEGYVKRFARVTINGFDIEGKPITIRVRDDLSIAFQHEIDHLNGILFIDKLTNNIDGIRTI